MELNHTALSYWCTGLNFLGVTFLGSSVVIDLTTRTNDGRADYAFLPLELALTACGGLVALAGVSLAIVLVRSKRMAGHTAPTQPS